MCTETYRRRVSEQVLGLCEDHGCGHMPVTGPPLGEQKKPIGESVTEEMYIFSYPGYKEAVNKARDFQKNRKVFFCSEWIPFHKITYSLSPNFSFLSLSVPFRSLWNTLWYLFTSVLNGAGVESGSRIEDVL